MNKMPMIATAVMLAAGAGTASATEYGTVISSTPVTQQIAAPQQQCWDEQQVVQQRSSGAGALVGALIGGAVGNQFGGGMGRAAATGLGFVAGAALGDRAEAANNPPVATTVRRCQPVAQYENRVVGYDVVYEYNGQRYNTRLAQDPGPRIALDVSVTPAGGMPPTAPPTSSLPPPVYSPRSPAPVAYAQPVYAQPVVYAPAPAYYYGAPPVVVVPRVVIGAQWHHGW